jgi:hypothetical protein
MPFFVVLHFFQSPQTTPSSDTQAKSKLIASLTQTTEVRHGLMDFSDNYRSTTTLKHADVLCTT